MAGSSFDYITLPSDAGNTGRKVLQRKVDIGGGEFRYANYFVEGRNERVLGVYRTVLPQFTVLQNAQDGTSTGVVWGVIPAGSTTYARIRQVKVMSQHSTALATPTAPRLVLRGFAFSGTPSGASVTPAKVHSVMPSPVLDLRTAVTGMTPTLASVPIGVAGIVGALTAVGAHAPCAIEMLETDEDGFPIVAAGQGFVIFQDVAGTASDTRKCNITIVHDECDFS